MRNCRKPERPNVAQCLAFYFLLSDDRRGSFKMFPESLGFLEIQNSTTIYDTLASK